MNKGIAFGNILIIYSFFFFLFILLAGAAQSKNKGTSVIPLQKCLKYF